MSLPSGNKNHDTGRIEDWIATEPPRTGSLISRLCAECVDTTKFAMKKMSLQDSLSKPMHRTLEKSCSSLILWVDGYGAVEGNLDATLERSRTLNRSVLAALINICDTLTKCLIPSVCAPDEDAQLRTDLLACLVSEAKDALQDIYQISESEGSDSESSSESVSDDWDQIASDMRTDVECLIDLEPLIKCPFIDSRKENSNQTKTTETPQWTPLKLYSDRIANRFPVAQAELVERLARANWDRFQRIQLEKERNIVNRDDERVAQEADLTTPTETGSAFQDSGLGTSLRTGSRSKERDTFLLPGMWTAGKNQGRHNVEVSLYDCVLKQSYVLNEHPGNTYLAI
ncbi:hypothetical protein CGCA056_v011068 [Colletotrichum aenigma]|uniref:uncharacterized protein n=1 Tax=Colletotrichum aenigma TaxID=1215731 RepID=UPI001872C842|nr:uncharacterized protein CGCA056_v011068 [Colletotrichum aenigma]KAF5517519.1 hypothetical protein CGCA056_v011068 [Colletotrichum aenigma]